MLSQLSYIPWGTANTVLLATSITEMSPSACESHWTRGRLSDLESLKSGKDRTKPWILFACALERTKRDGFSPCAEPPTLHRKMQALALSGRLLFVDLAIELLLADLIASVAAGL